ncbi:MAG: hypothetical protein C4B56_08470 [Candidatus Methanophagaceae archaeon]|nr:MAG: hypothetical protein C4B56_08470 [Methanophagales archaeon]
MGEEELGIVVNEDATAEEIAPIAKAVNDLFVMPVAMRSRNKKGVRVEKGEIIDSEYTGPVLEQVLRENRVIHTNLLKGKYAGVPVVVAPIRNRRGDAVAALGIFDLVGTVDLGALFADYPVVLEQVRSYRKGARK